MWDEADENCLTTAEQVTMLRIAVRTLTMFDEHDLACKVERVANAIQTAEFEGNPYRPGD